MTEKEIAETYVRSKLPELMELSFGCKVEYDGEVYRFVNDWDREEHGTDSKTLVLYSPELDADGLHYTAHLDTVEDKGEYEILGHPIQLQHWLRVLPKDGLILSASANFLYVRYVIRSKHHGKTLEFDYTTGKPATEADYQAFNEICKV